MSRAPKKNDTSLGGSSKVNQTRRKKYTSRRGRRPVPPLMLRRTRFQSGYSSSSSSNYSYPPVKRTLAKENIAIASTSKGPTTAEGAKAKTTAKEKEGKLAEDHRAKMTGAIPKKPIVPPLPVPVKKTAKVPSSVRKVAPSSPVKKTAKVPSSVRKVAPSSPVKNTAEVPSSVRKVAPSSPVKKTAKVPSSVRKASAVPPTAMSPRAVIPLPKKVVPGASAVDTARNAVPHTKTDIESKAGVSKIAASKIGQLPTPVATRSRIPIPIKKSAQLS